MSSGQRGYLEIPEAPKPIVLFEEFRMRSRRQSAADSVGTNRNLLGEDRRAINYDDCPGHPAWIEPAEWLGSADARKYPLHLLTTQPAHAAARPDGHGRASASKAKLRDASRCE